MNFLHPAYLWGLAALAVPLAIHLLSRKEGKVIRMGSLRHVHETPTRQFRSIRLNEYVLLLLRSIVVALLVLLISGWYLDGLSDHARWVVIEPGVESRPDLKQMFDSLEGAGFEARWLTPGFPEVGERRSSSRIDYAARLEELSRLPVEDVVVVAHNRHAGFFGPRVSLPVNVRWLDIENPASTVEVNRIQAGKDSVHVREGNFSAVSTTFTTYRRPGIDGRKPDTVHVIVASDAEYATDQKTLAVVLDVIRENSPNVLVVEQAPSGSYQPRPSTDWLFWLSASPPPAGDMSVIVASERGGRPVIEQRSPKRFDLTVRLNSESAIDRNLAAHLMGLLHADAVSNKLADSLDVRSVASSLAFSQLPAVVPAVKADMGNSTTTLYLAAVLACLILLERFVAYRRSQ